MATKIAIGYSSKHGHVRAIAERLAEIIDTLERHACAAGEKRALA